MVNTPLGVGWPGMPVEIAERATSPWLLYMETRWSAIEITANSGRSTLLISALFAARAEGAPPIFELLWLYDLRGVQGWSMANPEEYPRATAGVASKPRAFVAMEMAKNAENAQTQYIWPCATTEILI